MTELPSIEDVPMITYMAPLSKPNTMLGLDYNGNFHIIRINPNNNTYTLELLTYRAME